MNPPTANAMSLARAGDTVSADAAGSFSRTPMIVRPMPVRRRCPTSTSTTTSTTRHEVVVGAVQVREVDRAEVAARELRRSSRSPTGEDRPGEDVRLRRDRERERADRRAADPCTRSAPDPDGDRDQARERSRRAAAPRTNEHLRQAAPWRMRCRCQPMLNGTPADERGGAERAEARERHLPERQLTAPAGEHRHRDRAEREGEDRSRRSGGGPTRRTSSGRTIATSSASAGEELRHPPDPPDLAQPLGDRRRRAARTRSSRRRRRRCGSSARRGTSTTMKSTNCTSPVSFGKLKTSTW